MGMNTLCACADKIEEDLETEITFNDLPQVSQTFLNTYFSGITGKYEKKITNGYIFYEADLTNGYEIVFNTTGEWNEVDAPDGEIIPKGIAPQVIEDYINVNYKNYGINEINKTGYGYNVELSNLQGGTSINLSFNESGEVINPNNL